MTIAFKLARLSGRGVAALSRRSWRIHELSVAAGFEENRLVASPPLPACYEENRQA